MSSSAERQQLSAYLHKGSIEINTLVIWIILLVFLVLVLFIVLMVKDQGTGLLSGLCGKSGGLFGC